MPESMPERLTRLTDELQAAVAAQDGDPDPAHEDFFAWGWALTDVLDLSDLVLGVLTHQVARYGDRRILRDDAGVDPAERLAEIAGHVAATRTALAPARAAIRRYQAAASHVGVEVDPDAGTPP